MKNKENSPVFQHKIGVFCRVLQFPPSCSLQTETKYELWCCKNTLHYWELQQAEVFRTNTTEQQFLCRILKNIFAIKMHTFVIFFPVRYHLIPAPSFSTFLRLAGTPTCNGSIILLWLRTFLTLTMWKSYSSRTTRWMASGTTLKKKIILWWQLGQCKVSYTDWLYTIILNNNYYHYN